MATSGSTLASGGGDDGSGRIGSTQNGSGGTQDEDDASSPIYAKVNFEAKTKGKSKGTAAVHRVGDECWALFADDQMYYAVRCPLTLTITLTITLTLTTPPPHPCE
jgi:hypothetical protein